MSGRRFNVLSHTPTTSHPESRNNSLKTASDRRLPGNYLLIDVQYEATEGKYDYNPYDWIIRDSDGRTFDPSSGNYDGDVKELNSGTVAKGSKARGVIVIDAPKRQLTLEFGGGFGSEPATWNIP